MGIDIEQDFEPQYINIRGKGDVIKELKREAKKADCVFLATDPDREGEVWQSLADLLRQVERTRDVAFANQAFREASRAAGRWDWASAVRLEDAALTQLSSGHYDQSPEVVELQRRLEGQLAQHRQHSGQANLGKVLE